MHNKSSKPWHRASSVRRPWHATQTIPSPPLKSKCKKDHFFTFPNVGTPAPRLSRHAIKVKVYEIRNERRTARVPEWLNNTLCELQFNMLIFHNAHKLQSLKPAHNWFLIFLSLSFVQFRLPFAVAQRRARSFLCRVDRIELLVVAKWSVISLKVDAEIW